MREISFDRAESVRDDINKNENEIETAQLNFFRRRKEKVSQPLETHEETPKTATYYQ